MGEVEFINEIKNINRHMTNDQRKLIVDIVNAMTNREVIYRDIGIRRENNG